MRKVICFICILSMLSFTLLSCNNMEIEPPENDEIINYTITKEADYIATTPEDLYQISDVVVEGCFIQKINTYVSDNSFPVTQTIFRVNDIHKGEVANNKIIVEYYGGTVSMYSYLDSLTEDQIVKRGIDCSVVEAARMTVSYGVTKESVTVNENDTYMLFLSYDKEKDTYFILCDAYGACITSEGRVYSLVEDEFVDVEFN